MGVGFRSENWSVVLIRKRKKTVLSVLIQEVKGITRWENEKFISQMAK